MDVSAHNFIRLEQGEGGGIQVAREEGILPAIPPQQVAGEVVVDPRVRLGRIRAQLHQAGAGAGVQRQPLGIQVRIQNAGAGLGGGIQAPAGAPPARVEVAGGVGADAAGVARDAEQLARDAEQFAGVNRRGNPGDDAGVAAGVAADVQEERRERRLRMMR